MHFISLVFGFLTSRANWDGPQGIGHRLELQAELSFAVVAASSLAGLSLGFALGHARRGAFIAVNAANAARAVPSFALLTLLAVQPSISFAWGGFLASSIALFALAVPPIITNAYVGVSEVDAATREAARATGMSAWQMFSRIEVPLALPLAIAGVRTAAVEVVATATLAAYVGFSDLGEYIFTGLATQNNVETFAGAVLVAALAGLTDLVLLGVARLVVPEPLRRAHRPGAVRGVNAGATHRALARIEHGRAVRPVAPNA